MKELNWLIDFRKDYLERFGKKFKYISKFVLLINNSNENDIDNIFVRFDKGKEMETVKRKNIEGFWKWIEIELSADVEKICLAKYSYK